jgi:D-alanyl-D-alanine dipeptidase
MNVIKWRSLWPCLMIVGVPAFSDSIHEETQRPADFVELKGIAPPIQTEMRYNSDHNFVGRKIKGYFASKCLLTKTAAEALKTVEDKLLPMGLTLKVYDCYRPQMAVNDFAKWAMQTHNITMKAEFYPAIDKKNLFKDGYIAYRSGHSRGSTVDLTIVPINTVSAVYNAKTPLVSCTAPLGQRFADNSLDFGSGYDCFSLVSHPDYPALSAQAKANRLLLKTIMQQAGFDPLETEWWHFSLQHEPYPKTYFNFPIT